MMAHDVDGANRDLLSLLLWHETFFVMNVNVV
jgi:hypothetical protein